MTTDETPKEWPDDNKLTLRWLFDHMPTRYWAVFITLLVSSFGFGFFTHQQLSETDFNNNQAISPDNKNSAATGKLVDGIFVYGDPFPPPFRNFKLDTRRSELKSAFPDSEDVKAARNKSVETAVKFPADHYFSVAVYSFNTYLLFDPPAERVTFLTRHKDDPLDEKAAEKVKAALTTALEGYKFNTRNNMIQWPNVNGYTVTLRSNSIAIEPAER